MQVLDFPTQSDVFFRHLLGVVVVLRRGLLRAHYYLPPERRARETTTVVGSFSSRLSFVPLLLEKESGDFIIGGARSFNADKMRALVVKSVSFSRGKTKDL